ncbi:MAG: hypothetical protein IJT04_09005 [Bacteroidales bacterium]|nr:hypothetical protein [Bacteroidales bacterium]
MGMWVFDLYQNDTSLDVKDEFEELYNTGNAVRDITDKLTEDYKSIMGDIDEEPLFWLALADTQWNLGVLMPWVKEKSLYWIEKARGMLNCQSIDMSVQAKRRKTLDKLQAKLLSPQPPVKKPIKKGIYKCQWKLGDVFAYQLESNLAKEKGLYGRYFLLQKVDEGVCHPGHIVPIVYVKITNDNNLPSNIEEYNQLAYVQTWFTKYEDRFLPIDMRHPQENIAQKSKINYQVDEYGFLPQYRAKLLNTSKSAIPTNLIYVGNFANAVHPQKEFVPHLKENVISVSWKQFDETFETKMIKRYCGHNLRELSIYTARQSGDG